MNTAVVTREKLKETVQKAILKVPTGTCFVAGIRKAKDYDGTHQMMLEIVQLKNLKPEDAKEDLEISMSFGDSRFADTNRTIRVWVKMTIEGYDKKLPQLSEAKSGAELHEMVGKLTPEQVLMILTPFDEVMLNSGVIVKPTISVKQYSNPEGASFPQKIAKILDIAPIDRTTAQEEDLKSATMRTAEGESLVDESGQQVYELNKFTYGVEENIILLKTPLNIYKERLATIKARAPKTAGSMNELIG